VSEILKLFETTGGLTADQVLRFVVLFVPGLIALHVYDLQRGGEGRKINEVVLDVVVYSALSDLVTFMSLRGVFRAAPSLPGTVAADVIAGGLFLGIPIALAIGTFTLQRALMRSGAVPDTITAPWNQMMDRIASDNLDLGVIVTLRDGRTVGARIGPSSRCASSSEDLLLGEVWTVGDDRATLLEASPGSHALLVARSDCQTVEFVDLEVA
jgi:hypothetical protein